mmetsp:Transcript_60005/g.186134  ORF Transcript_60005/g.186134 Transcript_60005/m.186134 type:complete len:88 (+) Transcript_60005:1-264(+)
MPKSDLQVLSVARDRLGDAGAKAIIEALPPVVLSLDLAGNSLSDASASLVGDKLCTAPRLAVSLAQNHISTAVRDLLSREHGARLRV